MSRPRPLRRLDRLLFPYGWPSWLWPLGRWCSRHHDPITDRWHLWAFGEPPWRRQ